MGLIYYLYYYLNWLLLCSQIITVQFFLINHKIFLFCLQLIWGSGDSQWRARAHTSNTRPLSLSHSLFLPLHHYPLYPLLGNIPLTLSPAPPPLSSISLLLPPLLLLSLSPQWRLCRPRPGGRGEEPRFVLCCVTSNFYLKPLSRPRPAPGAAWFFPSFLCFCSLFFGSARFLFYTQLTKLHVVFTFNKQSSDACVFFALMIQVACSFVIDKQIQQART